VRRVSPIGPSLQVQILQYESVAVYQAERKPYGKIDLKKVDINENELMTLSLQLYRVVPVLMLSAS
jgi:hypothetical protein